MSRKAILALALFVAVPAAMAVPAKLTVTSSGFVGENGDLEPLFPDIAPGAAYELSFVTLYDTKDVRTWNETNSLLYPVRAVSGYNTVTLRVGDRTYSIESSSSGYNTGGVGIWQRQSGSVSIEKNFTAAGYGYYGIGMSFSGLGSEPVVTTPLVENFDRTYSVGYELDGGISGYDSLYPVPLRQFSMSPTSLRVTVSLVPEPATCFMMAGGLMLVGLAGRRSRRERDVKSS